MATEVILKNVRISFPHLFKKQAFDATSQPKYSAAFIVPKDSEADKAIRAAINAEAKEVLGAKAAGMLEQWKSNSMKCSYIDGDVIGRDEYEGAYRLTAKNDNRPLVIDADRSPLTADDGKPYAGCFVNAKVEIYVQKGEYAGVRCSLQGVQFAKDGPAFAGGRAANVDDFDDVTDGALAGDMI